MGKEPGAAPWGWLRVTNRSCAPERPASGGSQSSPSPSPPQSHYRPRPPPALLRPAHPCPRPLPPLSPLHCVPYPRPRPRPRGPLLPRPASCSCPAPARSPPQLLPSAGPASVPACRARRRCAGVPRRDFRPRSLAFSGCTNGWTGGPPGHEAPLRGAGARGAVVRERSVRGVGARGHVSECGRKTLRRECSGDSDQRPGGDSRCGQARVGLGLGAAPWLQVQALGALRSGPGSSVSALHNSARSPRRGENPGLTQGLKLRPPSTSMSRLLHAQASPQEHRWRQKLLKGENVTLPLAANCSWG
ncbi:Voltage-Dependent L-Type Calcium Channel Subunit Alpha-1S [Manis pentadactyla]|nr:Voltage-Dependent L-Type Calcium Channel Subunit Alpha-1S [Manis pentadactyla]